MDMHIPDFNHVFCDRITIMSQSPTCLSPPRGPIRVPGRLPSAPETADVNITLRVMSHFALTTEILTNAALKGAEPDRGRVQVDVGGSDRQDLGEPGALLSSGRFRMSAK